jgi:hypothetical protein
MFTPGMIPVMDYCFGRVYFPFPNNKAMKRLHPRVVIPILFAAILMLCGFGFHHHHNDFHPTAASQQSSVRILIILQKTMYKSELARILSEHYSSASVYTEVANFNILPVVNPGEWSAVIILQSWEDWQPQPEITSLIKRSDPTEKIVVVTTSDTGQEKLEGIDAISSASMVDHAHGTADKVIARIDKLLAK